MSSKKKSILFYCNVVLWKHQLSGFLSIINKEIKNKNRVYILFCDSTLESCPPNNTKIKVICDLCQYYQISSYKKHLSNKANLIKLELKPEKNKKKFYFKNYNELKDFKFDNVPLGLLVSSDLITFFKDSNLKYDEVEEIANKKLEASILLYKKSLEIIKKNNIDIVYSWNGRRGSDGPVLYAAKKLNKRYYSYISSHNSKYIIEKKSLNIHDLKIAKNEIKNIKLKKIFKNKENIKKYSKKAFNSLSKGEATNFKMFVGINKKEYSALNYNKKKKIITIFTSTLWEHSSLGKEWDLEFNNKKINFYDLLNQIVNNKKILKSHDIIIKWHPYHSYSSVNEKNEIEKFIKKNSHVKNYRYYENVSTYHLIKISDKVITIGSTTGVEYSYLTSKKLILLGPSYYEDLNFVQRCKNMNQLISAINNNLKLNNKSIYDLSKFIYWNLKEPYARRIKVIKSSIINQILLFIVSLIKKFYEKT